MGGRDGAREHESNGSWGERSPRSPPPTPAHAARVIQAALTHKGHTHAAGPTGVVRRACLTIM